MRPSADEEAGGPATREDTRGPGERSTIGERRRMMAQEGEGQARVTGGWLPKAEGWSVGDAEDGSVEHAFGNRRGDKGTINSHLHPRTWTTVTGEDAGRLVRRSGRDRLGDGRLGNGTGVCWLARACSVSDLVTLPAQTRSRLLSPGFFSFVPARAGEERVSVCQEPQPALPPSACAQAASSSPPLQFHAPRLVPRLLGFSASSPPPRTHASIVDRADEYRNPSLLVLLFTREILSRFEKSHLRPTDTDKRRIHNRKST